MNRIILLSSALFLLTCGHPPPGMANSTALPATASGQDGKDDEAARLRAELTQIRLENFDLKLKLARLTQKPADESRILEEALASDVPELQAAALRELAALPENRRKDAVPSVLARLSAGSDVFRAQAIAFLGRVPAPDAEAAVLGAAADSSSIVRTAAASALKSAAGERAEKALIGLLEDRDRDVRLAAIEALGVARREGAVAPLLAILSKESDDLVLEKAVDALGVIGSPAAVESLLEFLGRTARHRIRWSCVNSLGKIGDPRAADRIRAYLDESFPLEMRQVAIEALGKLKDAAAIAPIAALLRGDREEKIRQAAAGALGLMAAADAIEPTLLPAYLADPSENVRRAVWSAMLALAGDRVASIDKIAHAMLKAGRILEADQLCTKLHAAKVDPESRATRLALEEAVGQAAFQSGDFKSALPHYRQLASLAPERAEAARRLGACYRALDDLDSCLKTLGELKDPEPLIEEAHTILLGKLPNEKRKAVEQALRAGALRLTDLLATKDDAARKTALEAVRRQGRRILPSLAAEIEENPKAAPTVFEAGSLITGIPNDPAANGGKAKAAAWRAWLEKK